MIDHECSHESILCNAAGMPHDPLLQATGIRSCASLHDTQEKTLEKQIKITAAQPWLCCMHAKCCRGEVDAGKTPSLNVESTAGVLSSPH